jgi:hypothetical protein
MTRHAMKKFLFFSTLFALAPLVAQAGNMFGPAPFRNGSPLVSGVDGTYQATARAQNVTGVFRFAYAGGSQTANSRQNSWVFFVNGLVYRGNVEANISESSLDGIFDTAISSASTNRDGSIQLPYVYINQNDNAAGTFGGKLDLKSPAGAFSGKGVIEGLPDSTNQIIGISQLDALELNPTGNTPAGSIYVTTANVTNTGSSLLTTEFKFRGVRTSTTTQSSSTPTVPAGN